MTYKEFELGLRVRYKAEPQRGIGIIVGIRHEECLVYFPDWKGGHDGGSINYDTEAKILPGHKFPTSGKGHWFCSAKELEIAEADKDDPDKVRLRRAKPSDVKEVTKRMFEYME